MTLSSTPAPPVRYEFLFATPTGDGAPITDVNTLPVVSASVAAKIKAAAGLGVDATHGGALSPVALQPEADKPGTESWAVKTGQDTDRAKVGKNVVNGIDLHAGIVEAALEELVILPRPPGLEDATKDPPAFSHIRDGVTEVTIWRIEAQIIALKHESDGDYHLVLQGPSGQEMVGEIPTPTTLFIGDSPWMDNIKTARSQVDAKLVSQLKPTDFALVNGKYVRQGTASADPGRNAGISFVTAEEGSGRSQPLFQTAIAPTSARITGVGFFDRAHGATGAAPNVIELHPILKIEWL